MPASEPRHPFDTDTPIPFGPASGSMESGDPPTRSIPHSELNEAVRAGLSGTTAQQFWNTGIQVTRELGRGGMGVVYLALQVALNRHVAVKMLPKGGFSEPEMRRRFYAEAQIIAQLQHPNIIQIHSVGEMDGRPYFVLEYAAGGHLASRLGGRPLPPGSAASITAVLALALHHAHSKGVIHRDIKMENILLTEDGRPKLTDFGLAKWANGGGVNSMAGTIVGSPAYMSPEQAEGRTADIGPATDIYSLGVVLYQMLTGRVPFSGESLIATIGQICLQPPPPPRRFRADVPPQLEAICLKCLEKDPRNRYASAFDLAGDLKKFLANTPPASGQDRLAPATPSAPRPAGVARWLQLVIIALAVAVASFSVYAGIVYFGELNEQSAPSSGAPLKPIPSTPNPPPTRPEPPAKRILAWDAKKHVGQVVTVEFKVLSTGHTTTKRNEELYFLNSEKSHTEPNNFAIVIDAKSLPEFEKKGILDPIKIYEGKTLQVTGKMSEYKGAPQMVVTGPEQIRELK